MLNNILNLEGVAVLDKKQQSKILAGSCSIFIQGSGWTDKTLSVERAQEFYGDGNGDALWSLSGASVTGYCCSTCHKFKNHPDHSSGGGGGWMYA